MFLTDQGLELIGKQADKVKNVNLMFLVQILKEIREMKTLLQIHQDTCNCIGKSTAPEKEQGQSTTFLKDDFEGQTAGESPLGWVVNTAPDTSAKIAEIDGNKVLELIKVMYAVDHAE